MHRSSLRILVLALAVVAGAGADEVVGRGGAEEATAHDNGVEDRARYGHGWDERPDSTPGPAPS